VIDCHTSPDGVAAPDSAANDAKAIARRLRLRSV